VQLNENVAVLQAIAEMKPEAQMTPTGNGRYKEQAALSFCASELHATLVRALTHSICGAALTPAHVH